jgi:SAM-dependent methyltransferase
MDTAELRKMWDERYAREGFAFGDQPNDFLRSQEERIRAGGMRALCLGEGHGRNAIWLAKLGLKVTAVDLSAVGLSKAVEWASQSGLELSAVQADLREWEIQPDSWDLIVSIFCHMPSEIRAHVHRGVVRGLASGGVFILEAYTPSQIGRGTGGPPDPDMLPTAALLAAELEGLEVLESREITRNVLEGRSHTGISDVVQFVAQKSI